MSLLKHLTRYIANTPHRWANFIKSIPLYWDVIASVAVVSVMFFKSGLSVANTLLVTLIAVAYLVYVRHLRISGKCDIPKNAGLLSELPFMFTARLIAALVYTGLGVLLWIHIVF